jgi:hypothetical protein
MQSFQKYNVSEFLKDRHPYLDPPFTSDIDPCQVTLAVFFRKIPKLAACLNFENLPFHLRADALRTLNELVTHPETNDEMMRHSILRSCGTLLESESSSVRKEAALLIGGMVILMPARDLLIDSQVFEPLKAKLCDSELDVREAVAWTLKRLLLFRDGVERVVRTETVPTMVNAFIRFAKSPKPESRQYLIELLDGFGTLSQYDNGIVPMLGTGLTKCLINFLTSAEHMPSPGELHEKTLNVVANMALNHLGKNEACEARAIEAAGRFLKRKSSLEEKKLAAALIMAVTIALEGKFQAVRLEHKSHPIILKRLYKLLLDDVKSIRDNAKQCFYNIAELPEGFDKSVLILSHNIKILDEVFATRCIKPISRLLPKLSAYNDPPRVDPACLETCQRCIRALRFLVDKYDVQALTEAIDTVNISQKLAPFLSSTCGVEDDIVHLLNKVCSRCTHNKEVLKAFLSEFADDSILKTVEKHPGLVKD